MDDLDRAAKWSAGTQSQHDERRLQGVIDRPPNGMRPTIRRLRRPSSRWVRLPAGALLVAGGCLGVLLSSGSGCCRSDRCWC